jgi:hypothetical protein
MKEYEKRYKEVCDHGFYFEDDRIFSDFLDAIEKFAGPEINYYHTFIRILDRIVKFNAGVPDNYRQNDKRKSSYLPAIGGRNIEVTYKAELGENPTEQFKIYEIEIYDNATLKKWGNSRY